MKNEKLNDFIYSMRLYKSNDNFKFLYWIKQNNFYMPVVEPLRDSFIKINYGELVHRKQTILGLNSFSKKINL